jgi:hypothetical protein
MTKVSEDPIINVIVNGIKKDIIIVLDNRCYRAAAILMLSAIDTMAFLAMPESQDEVKRPNFNSWADEYIRFRGPEQLTGADLYGARCAMLHSYGVRSRMSRSGECRVLAYVDRSDPAVQFKPEVSKEVVFVSLEGLRDALFAGIDRFLIDVYKDRNSKEARLVDERLNTLVHEFAANSL